MISAAPAPAVTYRLQLSGSFTFEDAAAIVPYLAALGVTHCYCSPIFRATAGSSHGYDISRHNELNPELGGDAGFADFAAALDTHGLGLILDFVPNHMSNDPRTNDWWRDVLENGPSSPYAAFFDIDWDPTKPELHDRLLLPILGEQYGDTLERGALQLRYDHGALVLEYGDLTIPINPRRVPLVFEHGLAALETTLGTDSAALREFLSILTALRNLPIYTTREAAGISERQREKEVARERLAHLAAGNAAVRAHIDAALTAINGTPGEPCSFDRLHELLELQAYRLSSWRTASDEINYRRFFDINQLSALRVEDPRVFDEIHRLVLDLARAGRLGGLRLDHIDGLFDPAAYLARLRTALTAAAGDRGRDMFVVVEKILSRGERLREDWPVSGTTGYTFLNEVNALFVDGRGARKLARTYTRFTARAQPFDDTAYESKRLIIGTALASEFQVLALAINRLSEGDRKTRDFTLGSIRRALREVVACFPVYRTYVAAEGATAEDAAVVDAAIRDALARNPALEPSAFQFLRSVLLPSGDPSPDDGGLARARLDVAMRFQQYTAPVQAKGIEDTAFYRHHELASLNEVGGDPRQVGDPVSAFHRAAVDRRRRWPDDMLASTTHDTKRAEDARARINVLSEIPEAWTSAVLRWRRLNAGNRTRFNGGHAPDANDEYLFYQALVGCWPIDLHAERCDEAPAELVSRLSAYMEKATREAKRHTSWISPNADYEASVAGFVERVLRGKTAAAFLASFQPFVNRVAAAGMVNSLAQLVVKLGSPGVADFYQGTELWDQSLVDPDNRRPIDYALRRRLLDALEPAVTPQLLAAWPDGRIKMLVSITGMRLRRRHPEVFSRGEYVPLRAQGARAAHAVAFERRLDARRLLVLVPRLCTQLPGAPGLPLGAATWEDTTLHIGGDAAVSYDNLLTGARVATSAGPAGAVLHLADVFAACPVAWLWRE